MGIITGNIFGIMQSPKEFHGAFFLADMVNTELESIAASNSDEPFMMSVNIWGPHHPYYPTQEYVDLYTDENGVIGGNIEEYPSFNDPFINKLKVYAWDNSEKGTDNPSLPTPKKRIGKHSVPTWHLRTHKRQWWTKRWEQFLIR